MLLYFGHFSVILIISHYNELSGEGDSKWWEHWEKLFGFLFILAILLNILKKEQEN